ATRPARRQRVVRRRDELVPDGAAYQVFPSCGKSQPLGGGTVPPRRRPVKPWRGARPRLQDAATRLPVIAAEIRIISGSRRSSSSRRRRPSGAETDTAATLSPTPNTGTARQRTPISSSPSSTAYPCLAT